eukprot:GFUD01008037.1.p1 GENE.GFUD01008037.1~~GFUD01008037.1.p1  ORF type:complete len:316 (+),score=109.36 GFUD01008037.1:294-1241(+)
MYLVMCLMMVVVETSLSSLDCVIQAERRTIVRHDVECCCQDWYDDSQKFMWSDLDEIQQTDLQFHSILLTKCSKLHIDLHPPHPSPLPHLMMNNMEEVVIFIPKDMPHINLTITNVASVQYRPMGEEENMQDMLLYAALAVGVVLVLVLTVFLIVVLWTRLSSKDNSDAKKVSRAESWRYEASLYVNPSNRPQPVYVPPPPFPDCIQSSTSSRHRAPNSLSSSPLLRLKYNSMRQMDILRTQQKRQRQNTYHGTPPAYREPVDSIVCTQMEDRWGRRKISGAEVGDYFGSEDSLSMNSEPGDGQDEAQTLPHRDR